MRVKLYLTIFVLCVSALLFSCNRSSAPQSRKLLIYTPHGQDLLKESIARFKATHPDVEVQFLDMG
jgi:ABC-type glycerol-3-phosphate transport system substrate-binding protein